VQERFISQFDTHWMDHSDLETVTDERAHIVLGCSGHGGFLVMGWTEPSTFLNGLVVDPDASEPSKDGNESLRGSPLGGKRAGYGELAEIHDATVGDFYQIDHFSRYRSSGYLRTDIRLPVHRSANTIDRHEEDRQIGKPEGFDQELKEWAKFIDSPGGDRDRARLTRAHNSKLGILGKRSTDRRQVAAQPVRV
jgi:hypothetical protein